MGPSPKTRSTGDSGLGGGVTLRIKFRFLGVEVKLLSKPESLVTAAPANDGDFRICVGDTIKGLLGALSTVDL